MTQANRPGFGHSERTRDRLWTPSAQAEAISLALQALGIERAHIVGHSMGTLVAIAMGLVRPSQVRSLVLLSGYYFPTLRVDALLALPVALPGLGDVLRYTATAISSRVMLGSAVQAMFAPCEVPQDFFPILSREMMVRPTQLRADAEDASFMVPAAARLSKRYAELKMPVSIIAGAEDGIVDVNSHSRRLHACLPQSSLVVLPRTGHMTHYVANADVTNALEVGERATVEGLVEP